VKAAQYDFRKRSYPDAGIGDGNIFKCCERLWRAALEVSAFGVAGVVLTQGAL
jgi:hypothetical protein